jgi:hypothetical protein
MKTKLVSSYYPWYVVQYPKTDVVAIFFFSTYHQVEDGTLSASLSPDGTLTFLEETLDSSAFAPEAVESMLRQAQDSGELLTELNMSIMKSRELLTKVRHFELSLSSSLRNRISLSVQALKEKEASAGYATAGSPGYDEEPDIWTGGRSGRRVDGLFDD